MLKDLSQGISVHDCGGLPVNKGRLELQGQAGTPSAAAEATVYRLNFLSQGNPSSIQLIKPFI